MRQSLPVPILKGAILVLVIMAMLVMGMNAQVSCLMALTFELFDNILSLICQ